MQTGVTRKIDDLGRIVIPKEIRRNLGIRDGESLEIVVSDNTIILKKYSDIKRIDNISEKLCELISNIYNVDVIITDREKVIVSSINNIINKKISNELINLIDNRECFFKNNVSSIMFGDINIIGYITCVPIIVSSDSLGLFIVVDKNNNYLNLAKLGAKILVENLDI